MNNRSHYYLNKGATLVIKRDDVFKNKNYMKGVTSVTLHGEAIVSEFPTQEMVESPTLKNVNVLGKVRNFRRDRMKELKLEDLNIVVHDHIIKNRRQEMFGEDVPGISDPSVLKSLTIDGHRNRFIMTTAFLKEISKAKNLEHLQLERLHIFKFPDAFFFQFPKLTYLSLRENRITDPNELNDIHALQKLEELDLSNNKLLKRLPDSITKLKKLKKLDLFGVRALESLPNNIGNMNSLTDITVSHNGKINIPESILKLRNNARIEYLHSEGENYSRNARMTVRNYYNHWKSAPRVPIRYINQKIPNNGASNSISYVNFKTGNTAMRIKNANRSPTYMTVNTFKRLANNRTAQGRNHIYKRRNDVKNINDVYKLNGNTNVFINPMTTKMVKRSNIDFVKFV